MRKLPFPLGGEGSFVSCGNSLMMSEQDGFFTKILLLVEQAALFCYI